MGCGAQWRARGKVEAWPFVVVVGREWHRGNVVAGAGGHAGEWGSGQASTRTGAETSRVWVGWGGVVMVLLCTGLNGWRAAVRRKFRSSLNSFLP